MKKPLKKCSPEETRLVQKTRVAFEGLLMIWLVSSALFMGAGNCEDEEEVIPDEDDVCIGRYFDDDDFDGITSDASIIADANVFECTTGDDRVCHCISEGTANIFTDTTSLFINCVPCGGEDAGTNPADDSGTTLVDAGEGPGPQSDGGTTLVDAGEGTPPDGGVQGVDAGEGTPPDAGTSPADAGPMDAGPPVNPAVIQYRRVLAQTSLAGCLNGRDGNTCGAKDTHEVTLTHSIEMSRSEITQAQMAALTSYNPSDYQGVECPNCPVIGLSWHAAAWLANKVSEEAGYETCYTCTGDPTVDPDALECTHLTTPYLCKGFRMPTAAEWERAARGGESFRYAGSDDLDAIAWHRGNTEPANGPWVPKVSCDKAPNGYGLCGMTGNAPEWLESAWSYNAPEQFVDPYYPGTLDCYVEGNFQGTEPLEITAPRACWSASQRRSYNLGARFVRTLEFDDWPHLFLPSMDYDEYDEVFFTSEELDLDLEYSLTRVCMDDPTHVLNVDTFEDDTGVVYEWSAQPAGVVTLMVDSVDNHKATFTCIAEGDVTIIASSNGFGEAKQTIECRICQGTQAEAADLSMSKLKRALGPRVMYGPTLTNIETFDHPSSAFGPIAVENDRSTIYSVNFGAYARQVNSVGTLLNCNTEDLHCVRTANMERDFGRVYQFSVLGDVPAGSESDAGGDGRYMTYGLYLDTDNDPANNYVAPASSPQDPRDGTDTWYLVTKDATSNFSATVTRYVNGEMVVSQFPQGGFIAYGNSFAFVIGDPELYLDVPVGARFSVYEQEGPEEIPTGAYKGSVWPPVGTPPTVVGAGFDRY